MVLEAVSSSTVLLRPPEQLFLQIRATGRYVRIEWTVNGVVMTTPEQFIHFNEIYVRDTTVSDLGLYEVGLAPSQSQAAPEEIEFFVIEPGML